MSGLDLIKIFTDRLNQADIGYFVTGSVASIIYGEPRLTHDIDLVVELDRKDASRVVGAFPLGEFYCPPIEVIQLEIGRPLHGHFNLIHHQTGFKADVYAMGRDKLHHWAMGNRRKLDLEGEPIWLAPPEYVIVRKLQYYREGRSEKHLADIAGMITISADQIDFDVLRERIQQYNLAEEWQEAKRLAQG
jgi:hypothetical protein